MRKFIAAVRSVLATVRTGAMVQTTHGVARRTVAYCNQRMAAAEAKGRDLNRERMIYEWRMDAQARTLAAPNRLEFPTFFQFKVGENTFGISLVGLRCDFPALAMKYGRELDSGNRVYTNWLGTHFW